MATASPARIAANRVNAQKSTGPRTPEGKARARANAVKHGLTGAGVALPDEDAAGVEALFREIQEELAPSTRLGAELAHDVAVLTVRKHRARTAQAAQLRARVRRAAADFDARRASQADRLIDAIEVHPRPCRRELLTTPEGVDRLIAALGELNDDLLGPSPSWSHAHHQRLDALFGFRVADLPWSRPTRFSRAVNGDFEAIGDAELADLLEDTSPRAWATDRLAEVIAAEVESLHAQRATLDLEAIALDRADAAAASRFDSGHEAELAHRYEATATRDLARALRDFTLAEALGTADHPADAEPAFSDPTPAEPPIPTAEKPAPADPNPFPDNDIPTPLGSFGELAPSSPITTPVAPSAPLRAVAPVAPNPTYGLVGR